MKKQQGVGWMERSAIHQFELRWIPAGTTPPSSTLRFLRTLQFVVEYRKKVFDALR